VEVAAAAADNDLAIQAWEKINMGIRTLQFSEPFYTIKFIDNERQYKIDDTSIVISLAEKGILIRDRPLEYLKSTIVRNVIINDIQRTLVIEGYEKKAVDAELFSKIQDQWPLMYDITHEERFKGIPARRSPKEKVENIELNLFFVAARTNVGLHKQHNHLEVHTQLLGYGRMQKFEEKNYDTLYQEEILAPGNTHEPFYNEENVYPWHQYQSISDSIYLYVIIEASK
jgi:hypothetical protein